MRLGHLGTALCFAGLAGCAEQVDAPPPVGHGDVTTSTGTGMTGEGGGGGLSGGSSVSSGAGGDEAPVVGDIVWRVDGESGGLSSADASHDGINTNLCSAYAAQSVFLSDGPGYGDAAIAIHLDAAWPWGPSNGCNKTIRAFLNNKEVVQIGEGEGTWLGWAIYVPEDWEPSATSYGTMVFHGPGGTPPQFRVSISGEQWRVTSKPGLAPTVTWELERGRYHEFVVHAVFSKDATQGIFKLWHRERGQDAFSLALDHEGKTAQDSAEFPFHPRLGLIGGAPPWTDPVPQRTVYLDEIRLGGAGSSLDEVAPGSGVVGP